MSFSERFAQLVERVGGDKKAADAVDKSPKQISRYRKGDQEPPYSVVASLIERANLTMNWMTGEDEVGGGLIKLPVLNVTASAGDGRMVWEERQVGVVGFDEQWLRASWRVNPENLFSIQAIGDSMEPTISDGEFILVSKDRADRKPGEGVYVIRLDGDILVKRLQRLPGHKIKVSSDNEDLYDPIEIDLADEAQDFKILGRVVLVHGLRRV